MEKETKTDPEIQPTSNSQIGSEQVLVELSATQQKLEDLNRAILDKAAEIEDLHGETIAQEEKFEAEVSSLKAQLDEISSKLEAAIKERDEAVNTLNSIKEEAMLNDRLGKLKELKVLRSTEEAQIKQAEKVKSMSAEEFDDYINELLDVTQIKQTDVIPASSATQPSESAETETELEEASKALESAPEAAKDKIRMMLEGLLKTEKSSKDTSTVEDTESAVKEIASEGKKLSLSEGFIKMLKYNN